MMRYLIAFFIVLCSLVGGPVRADEKLAGIACRSVHFGYDAPPALAFYNEIRVHRSAPGSYFMVCGWHAGYFGMQELVNGKKLLLFSVWDSQDNDKDKTPLDQRVRVAHQHEKVRVQRFGGEGSGGQSFFDYDWKVETTYRFLVQARRNEDRVEYAGYFFHPESDSWLHLITFAARRANENAERLPLSGTYSFIEDFHRNRESATRERTATFGNPLVRLADGWRPVWRARFTADANPSMAIDAALREDRFYLATGGSTKNAGNRLLSWLERQPQNDLPQPANLPKPL